MNGHKSVVSTLAVCDGVLYSGSWDGTIRLWSLNDHSALAVLGEDMPGNVTSVLSLTADGDMLIASFENGCIKVLYSFTLLELGSISQGVLTPLRYEMIRYSQVRDINSLPNYLKKKVPKIFCHVRFSIYHNVNARAEFLPFINILKLPYYLYYIYIYIY